MFDCGLEWHRLCLDDTYAQVNVYIFHACELRLCNYNRGNVARRRRQDMRMDSLTHKSAMTNPRPRSGMYMRICNGNQRPRAHCILRTILPRLSLDLDPTSKTRRARRNAIDESKNVYIYAVYCSSILDHLHHPLL